MSEESVDDATTHAQEVMGDDEAHDVALEKVEADDDIWHSIHPVGWVAAAVMALALVFTAIGTDALIGNLAWWHWTVLVGLALASIRPVVLHRLRLGIESIATVTKTIAWILAWVVFLVSLFNVVTRYGNDLVERDILYGEAVSIAWQSFALMFLVGINYGVRDGVNPRIDFWWANFKPRTKAWLDFVLHVTLLIPFILMGLRIMLANYVPNSLGRKANGEWPNGWKVWKSWEESGDAGQLPIGPIKAMMVVAFVLFGLQIIAEIIKTGFVMIGSTKYGELKEHDVPQRIE